MTTTLDLKTVTDEQLDAKIKELSSKADKSVEEQKELELLKDEKPSRYQKRIDKFSYEKKKAEEEKRLAEEKLAEREREIEELKKKNKQDDPPVTVKKTTVEIGGKNYYTDEALSSMAQAGEMGQNEAYSHQQARIKAEIKQDVMLELDTKKKTESEKELRDQDSKEVLSKYPHFDKNHKDHDPEDPLFKLASELWTESYQANPKGLSLAIKRAKQILRTDDRNPDVTGDLNLHSPSAPERRLSGEEKKPVPLSAEEKEIAERQFVMSGRINPLTRKPYTKEEAHATAEKAKNSRSRRVV